MNLLLTLSIWLAVIFVILTAFYFYLTLNFDYWEKQGVPYAKPLPGLGNIPLSLNIKLEETDMINYKKYGRVFGAFEGRSPILFVGDPNLLKQVLQNDCYSTFSNHRKFECCQYITGKIMGVLRDKEWKAVRKIVTPAFTSVKLNQMVDQMEESVEKVNSSLESYAVNKETIDITNYFKAYTVDVIANCVFGIELNSLKNEDNSFIKNADKCMDILTKFGPLILFPSLCKLIPKSLTFGDCENFFERKVKEIFELRKANKQERKCFIDLLLQERNGQFGSEVLTERIIIAQCMFFVIAGLETTASNLSFIVYTLATRSDIQEKLIAEVDEAMEKSSGKISYDAIRELKYLDMVVCETLRMYPPLIRTDRECAVDNYKLGNVMLKKSMLVNIPIYCIHYDEEFYPNPQVFDPERFSRENEAKRNPFTYLPFGIGPRSCIGNRFALMEIKLCLVHFLSKYRVVASPQLEMPVKFKTQRGIFLTPEAVMVILEVRNE